MSPDTAPLVDRQQAQQDAVATGSDSKIEVTTAKFAGTVSKCTYTPISAITGAATNNRTHSLVNRAQDGTGTTVVATLNYASGTNAAAEDETTITLSGTPANLVVAQGDVLEFQSTHIGTGIADPGGLVVVEITRS